MKTPVKQIASVTFIALLLMVGNVKASETETRSLKATETNLQLENWMVNETVWNNKATTIVNVSLEVEATLELENWMTSDETWNVEDTNLEAELKVEDWMIDNEVWK